MPYAETAEEKLREQQMMENPERWPRWPILPVKRQSTTGGGFPECEIMVAIAGRQTIVYETDMFSLKSGVSLGEQLDAAKKYEYKSTEEIVNDGWVVD